MIHLVTIVVWSVRFQFFVWRKYFFPFGRCFTRFESFSARHNWKMFSFDQTFSEIVFTLNLQHFQKLFSRIYFVSNKNALWWMKVIMIVEDVESHLPCMTILSESVAHPQWVHQGFTFLWDNLNSSLPTDSVWMKIRRKSVRNLKRRPADLSACLGFFREFYCDVLTAFCKNVFLELEFSNSKIIGALRAWY